MIKSPYYYFHFLCLHSLVPANTACYAGYFKSAGCEYSSFSVETEAISYPEYARSNGHTLGTRLRQRRNEGLPTMHCISLLSKSKDIKRVHSSQNKSHARSAILRMRNLPASTVKFFYKEIDGEIRNFVIKTAILTKLSR